MLTYTITGDNVAIDQEVHDHVGRHYKTFEKFMDPAEDREIDVVVSKNTNHQRENTYKIEVSFKMRRGDFFVTVENAEIVDGINEAKEKLTREIVSKKDKKRTVFHRGARKVKAFAKGLVNKRSK